MRLQRPIDTPARGSLPVDQLWLAEDWGVIAAWERGRDMARERPELAAAAMRGELVILPWRGGVERALKSGRKFGSYRYLAMWQGLRGEDLLIDLDLERDMVCTKHGVTVTYTHDFAKFTADETA